MYNMVAIVDKTILYNWNLLKVELNYSYQKKKKANIWGNKYVN